MVTHWNLLDELLRLGVEGIDRIPQVLLVESPNDISDLIYNICMIYFTMYICILIYRGHRPCNVNPLFNINLRFMKGF